MFHLLPYNMDGALPDRDLDLVKEATFAFPSCYARISFGDTDKYQKEMLFVVSTGEYLSYIDVIHRYFGVHEIIKHIKQHVSIGRDNGSRPDTPVHTLVQGVCWMDHLTLSLPGTAFKYQLWHVQYPQSEGILRRVKEVVVDDMMLHWMRAYKDRNKTNTNSYEYVVYEEIQSIQEREELRYELSLL